MEVSIFTFGCKVNQYEGQLIREGFERNGFQLRDDLNSDYIVINSCAVTRNAERDVVKLVKRVLKNNTRANIIIIGCYTQELVEKVEKVTNTVKFIPQCDKQNIMQILNLPHPLPQKINYFHKHTRAFIKIQDGCNNFCSYCVVPYLRQKIYSRPIDEIIDEINTFIANQCPEIVLTGIRLDMYNYKTNGTEYNLAGLIKRIISLPGNFKVRLSSLELRGISEELIELISSSPKIVKHLHIPLQSGSNRILALMNRGYTAEEYIEKISLLKQKIPDIAITTDIIVGFPTETEEDFTQTYQLCQNLKFAKMHIFPYSERPLTEARKLPKIHQYQMQQRLQKLQQLNACLQKSIPSFAIKIDSIKTNYFPCFAH